jgi:hypothetical protein
MPFFFLILDCEAIGTTATPGLLCQPRVIVKMIVEKQMECRLAGETEVLRENMPQRHFCPSQNPTWPDLGLKPGRRGVKPVTNRLSYGAGSVHALDRAATVIGDWAIVALPNINRLIKLRRIGREYSMNGTDVNAWNNLVGKPKVKTTWRYVRNREDNIRIDVKGMGLLPDDVGIRFPLHSQRLYSVTSQEIKVKTLPAVKLSDFTQCQW